MEEVGNDGPPVSPLSKLGNDFSRGFQYYLVRSAPHIANRWRGTLAVAAIYVLRVYSVRGFYVISYGLAIYILNLLIGFMSPKVDPELEVIDGSSLPTKESDEFRPFICRLPEFKFWYAITKAFCVAFLMTYFSVFDVPVFWPILFFYWVFLFFLTMKRQITHMIRYGYVPYNLGKQHNNIKFQKTTTIYVRLAEMVVSGTYVLILFFWALLTIVTPMLVRMSASANLYKRFYHGERREDVVLLFPRRGLIAAEVSPSPAPAPAVKGGVSDRDVLFDEFVNHFDRN